MSSTRRSGFTLVELLIVIGIIGVLVSILLPVVGRARESANTIKCSSNLRSIGQAISVYVAQNNGALPASNYYKGLSLTAGVQLPTQPVNGYVHWSSFLYGKSDQTSSNAPYLDTRGWEAFQCPSLQNGGLPPANTYEGNNDGLSNESPGQIDWQAPRLAYTVNEALCPRGIFQKFFADRGNVRIYHFVKFSSVKRAASVILATEIWGTQAAVQADSLTGGEKVSASRRPINGFTGGIQSPDQLYKVAIRSNFARAKLADLGKTPERNAGASPQTLLDWVGRNHGSYRTDGQGYDARLSNFLYLDGHVETKHVRATVEPFEWGDAFYTLQ